MEYDFVFDRDTRHYRMRLASEQLALQRFLLDEFAHTASAYQSLATVLHTLKPYQDWHYHGVEYSLFVHQHEVTICHNTLLYEDDAALPESLQDAALQLDDQTLQSECGLVDLQLLLRAWQAFLPD